MHDVPEGGAEISFAAVGAEDFQAGRWSSNEAISYRALFRLARQALLKVGFELRVRSAHCIRLHRDRRRQAHVVVFDDLRAVAT